MVTRKKANTPPKPLANPVVAKAPRSRRRSVAAGDVPPVLTPPAIEGFTVHSSVDAAQESKMGAMQDVVAGMPVDESVALLKSLLRQQRMTVSTWSATWTRSRSSRVAGSGASRGGVKPAPRMACMTA